MQFQQFHPITDHIGGSRANYITEYIVVLPVVPIIVRRLCKILLPSLRLLPRIRARRLVTSFPPWRSFFNSIHVTTEFFTVVARRGWSGSVSILRTTIIFSQLGEGFQFSPFIISLCIRMVVSKPNLIIE